MRWQHRPARDLGLPPLTRLRSLDRERGLGAIALHWLWLRLVRLWLALAHRPEVVGRELLPPAPPFVLVANHTSHLDSLALCGMLRGRTALRTYPLAAGEVFFGTAGTSALAALAVNALPVWRGHTGRQDLAVLRARLLEDGVAYILFPEGTRGRMAAFRHGLGTLVAGTSIPVVPCHIAGGFACWPAHRRLPRPGRLRITIGAPLAFEAVANDRAGWAAVAGAAEQAVRELARSGEKASVPIAV
jgi:1-acyl-sn-glycerol-3-phosphate acyltransferase